MKLFNAPTIYIQSHRYTENFNGHNLWGKKNLKTRLNQPLGGENSKCLRKPLKNYDKYATNSCHKSKSISKMILIQ